MLFVLLLAVTTAAIAGSAAYFSVYGLANTFAGVFWSVVIMGGSLEAGKLVATSYLYRYWLDTPKLLRGYLIASVGALMLLTSMGIFGYLSSGYQTDMLPLQQIESQVKLLEQEKTTKLDRKKQIDKQIADLPADYVTGRNVLINQFRVEQKDVTVRLNELDKQILELRQQQIKSEAHVGPIIYIAKAFNLATDDATKYIIFLIIFAFDPMAVALTLALNIVIRKREEEPTTPPTDWLTFDTNKQSILPTEMIEEPIIEQLPKVEEVVPEEPSSGHTILLRRPILYPIPGDMAMPAPDPEPVVEPTPVESPLVNLMDTVQEKPIENEETQFIKEMYDNVQQGNPHNAQNTFFYTNKMSLEQKLGEISKYYHRLVRLPDPTDLEKSHMVRARKILDNHKL